MVTLAIGYLASILLARSLGPAGRGLIAVMQADVALIVSLAGLGTPAAITYFASRRLRYQPALSGFALIYGCVLGVLSFATVLLAGGWIADHQGHGFDDRLWWLVAALIPLMYIEFFATSLLNARRAFALSNRLNILGRVGTLVATASLVTGLEWGIAGGLIAASMISLVKIAGTVPTVARIGLRAPVAPPRRGDAQLRLAGRDRADVPLLLGALRRARAVLACSARDRRQLRHRADGRRARAHHSAVVRIRRHADGGRG